MDEGVTQQPPHFPAVQQETRKGLAHRRWVGSNINKGACFERLARAQRDTLISSARITHHVALTHQEPATGLAKSPWWRDPARHKGEPRKAGAVFTPKELAKYVWHKPVCVGGPCRNRPTAHLNLPCRCSIVGSSADFLRMLSDGGARFHGLHIGL